MKEYIQNLQSKTPHEQRMHAMRLSGIVTIAVFFVWLTATGVRLSFTAFGPTTPKDASADNQTTIANGTDQNQAQLANVISAAPGSTNADSGAMGTSNNTLEVATTTDTGGSLVSPQ